MNNQRIAQELVAVARELAAGPVIKTGDALLNLRNLDEGRLDADSYESRETLNFLLMKARRLQDAGQYLEGRAKELKDFIATDGKANAKMLGYLRKAIERFQKEGLMGR